MGTVTFNADNGTSTRATRSNPPRKYYRGMYWTPQVTVTSVWIAPRRNEVEGFQAIYTTRYTGIGRGIYAYGPNYTHMYFSRTSYNHELDPKAIPAPDAVTLGGVTFERAPF